MGVDVTVVVPSHDRPDRLRWLLNALEEQTLAPERFDVVVVHDSAGEETQELLEAHGLTRAGRLEHVRLPAGTGRPGRQRDEGWQRVAAPLAAFVDDDCRPAPDWLEALLDAALAHPGAVVQGRVVPDPLEEEHLLAPHHRTLRVDPLGPFFQTANILYPRAALEATGGFARTAHLTAGEDTDLALRARALGWALAGAPEAVVFHAIESTGLRGALRTTRKWADLAYVVRHHPELRELLWARLFWRREHALLLLAAAGALTPLPRPAPRVERLAGPLHAGLRVAAATPYLLARADPRGGPRALLRDLMRLPGRLLLDAAEVTTCARGALRHRTWFL